MSVEVKVVSVKGFQFTGVYLALPSREDVKSDIDGQTMDAAGKAALKTVVDGVLFWPRLGAALGFTRQVIVDGRKIGTISFTVAGNNKLGF